MYHESAQGVDERMINVHYYYYSLPPRPQPPSRPHAQSPLTADSPQPKLQAPVYDILPSTTAVFSYAIGSRKLSANEQFFVGAQTLTE